MNENHDEHGLFSSGGGGGGHASDKAKAHEASRLAQAHSSATRPGSGTKAQHTAAAAAHTAAAAAHRAAAASTSGQDAAVHSNHAEAHDRSAAEHSTIAGMRGRGRASKGLCVVGDKAARVLIVKGPPTSAERLRGEPFINDERAMLERFVLEPAGLSREQVMTAWCEDTAQIEAFAKSAGIECVISVSRLVRFAKQQGRWNLPELGEVAQNETRHALEIARKCVSLKRILDTSGAVTACSLAVVSKGDLPTLDTKHIAPIKKAKPAQQIVYGVVLDPYLVDAHNDWIPPADIERTAIEFMKRRVITLQHEEMLPDAFLVENFVEPYPSDSDREKAHANEPHRAYARMYGTDRIHSGAWVIGVQLPDEVWKQYLQGQVGAFSIEGYGVRENLTQAAMPNVTFVELGEVGRVVGQEDPKARLA